MNEKISAAAIKAGDSIFTGTTHFAATELLLSDDSIPQQAKDSVQYGYVTNAGRFVSREEAFIIAKSGGQVHGDLADPVHNMNFYGSATPRLDASFVSHYAEFNS